MLGLERLHLRQPQTKRPVFEIAVTNFFGRWMERKGWGGFTLALGLFHIIFYWMPTAEVHPLMRVHEFAHVEQAERPGPFWIQYLQAHRAGYKVNPFEVEARAAEQKAHDEGLPDWARDGYFRT